MQEHLHLTPTEAIIVLSEQIRAEAAEREGRVLIGITGGPGVGKSTLGAALVTELNGPHADFSALVPMDGFHMRHAKLAELGIAGDKGAPHTFEARAFADFLAELKQASTPVTGPGYSRQIEDVVDDAFIVPAAAQVLVTEGNYLLLPDGDWAGIAPLLDLTIFLSVPREIVEARLLLRHAQAGLFTEERNREHVSRVDLPNYDLVEAVRDRADILVDLVVRR